MPSDLSIVDTLAFTKVIQNRFNVKDANQSIDDWQNKLYRRSVWLLCFSEIAAGVINEDKLRDLSSTNIYDCNFLDLSKCALVDDVTARFLPGCYANEKIDGTIFRLGMVSGIFTPEEFLREVARYAKNLRKREEVEKAVEAERFLENMRASLNEESDFDAAEDEDYESDEDEGYEFVDCEGYESDEDEDDYEYEDEFDSFIFNSSERVGSKSPGHGQIEVEATMVSKSCLLLSLTCQIFICFQVDLTVFDLFIGSTSRTPSLPNASAERGGVIAPSARGTESTSWPRFSRNFATFPIFMLATLTKTASFPRISSRQYR